MSGNQVDQLLNDVGWYEGEYKDGKYHGQGIYSYPDRSKYEGRYVSQSHQVGSRVLLRRPIKILS